MAAPPNSSARTDIELLTEHFGYPPVSLLDDIINSINILAERAINSIEQGLLNAPPASLGFRPPTHSNPSSTASKSKNASSLPDAATAHQHEIEAGTHQLETLLFASIDKNFDVFEIYVMRNILCIRPEDRDWIRLSHYGGLDFSQPAAEQADKPTVEGVNHLRRRLQASQKLNCMLHAEKARNESLLGELRRLVGGRGVGGMVKREEGDGGKPPFGFLHDKGDLVVGGGETPVTTTTAFTLSQLEALRALSTSLRTIMPDLGGQDGGLNESDQERKRSWRRERLEYVESATRKHLENVRGLDLGRNGEVRDGEWDGGGRSIGQEEVEGLEKVATALGGGEGNKMDES